tara:strand:- start:149 stop:502 length:354 start_codon:yes stop_codon:yes gene_type:complete
MSSELIYDSQYNKIMSGGYMVGSGLFKQNINTEHIMNYNKNLAVPIGLLNYRGGKSYQDDEHARETYDSGINSTMIGGSIFDNLLKQIDPSYKESKTNGGTKKNVKKHNSKTRKNKN